MDYDPGEEVEVLMLEEDQQEVNILDLDGDLERRRQVLSQHHDTPEAGHPGQERTLEKIARLLSWPTMRQDVRNYVGTCDACQRNKPRNGKPLLPIPESRFNCVGLDWFALPKDSQGFDSVMIVVDYFTKLTVLVPSKSSFGSQQAAQFFKKNWVHQGFGIPSTIISDRDSKLTSRFWKTLCSSLGNPSSWPRQDINKPMDKWSGQ